MFGHKNSHSERLCISSQANVPPPTYEDANVPPPSYDEVARAWLLPGRALAPPMLSSAMNNNL